MGSNKEKSNIVLAILEIWLELFTNPNKPLLLFGEHMLSFMIFFFLKIVIP